MMFGLFSGKKGALTVAGKPPVRASLPVGKPGAPRPRVPQAGAPQAVAARQKPREAPPRVVDDEDDRDDATPIVARQVALVPRAKPAGFAPNLPVAHLNEPGEDKVAEFLAYAGKVVSGDIHMTQRQRQLFAAFEDGTILVARSEAQSSAVTSARQLLVRGGYRHKETFHVDLEVIRRVYEAYNRRTGTVTPAREMDTASMQRTVVELIRAAAAMRCSDIHITVEHYEAKIRVRSDGVMMKLKELPSATAYDLCNAAFNMADASDATYKPYEYQGARITSVKSQLPEGVQAVRLQFNPLPDGGRYAVMRLLYSQKVAANEDVDKLGYSKRQIVQIKRMREKPFGINIISGPTGSGKSTTLQRSLTATLRDKRYEVNLITVEDPPEYEITGAAQLPVLNVKTEEERREAFRAAITASLRSDPDIVMIGEIRDGASGALAFQAAMTGHQVWASLHANDAVSILDRLRDVGVETYKLTDPSLMTGLIGQRLIRRLCDKCKLSWKEGVERGFFPEDQSDIVCEAVGGEANADRYVKVANPEGCANCSKRGFVGRTVAAETILPDKKFMDHIAAEDKTSAVAYWLGDLDGMSMLEHSMVKMMMGECDPRDVKDRVGVIDTCDPARIVRFARESGIL